MKKLFLSSLFVIGLISFSIAQEANNNNTVTQEDYKRYLDEKMEMDFRLSAMEAIDLTPEEIEAFNPVFDNYIAAKDMVMDRKMRALEDFVEDMEEEVLPEKLDEETSDFIESYWEAEIAEMELKKQTYDILENKIPYKKAINFFLFEESAENMVSYNILRSEMPTILFFEKSRSLPVANNKPADVSDKEWSLYIDKKLEMDFRLAAIEEMNLTAEEINEFNPLFDKYIDRKDKITERKFQLTEDYISEMNEEEDEADRTEATSDYIEEYWEEEIAEMKIKEEFYDVLENKIPYNKAIQFFLLEDALENRVRYDDLKMEMPDLLIFEKSGKSKDAKNKMHKSHKKSKEHKAAHKHSTSHIDATHGATSPRTHVPNMNNNTTETALTNPTSTQSKNANNTVVNPYDVTYEMGVDKGTTILDEKVNNKMAITTRHDNTNVANTKVTPVVRAEDITYEIGLDKGTTILDEKVDSKIATTTKQDNTNVVTTKVTPVVRAEDISYEIGLDKGTTILDEKIRTKSVATPKIKSSDSANNTDEFTSATRAEETTYEIGLDRGTSILDEKTNDKMISDSKSDSEMPASSSIEVTPIDGTDKNMVSTNAKIIKKPYSKELFALDNWVSTHRGQMSLDHDYTSNGLKATVAAIESVSKSTPLSMDNWEIHKSSILNAAREITIDAYATNHADLVGAAFKRISKCAEILNGKNPTMETINKVATLNGIAYKINPDMLLLKQDKIVYDFFSQANDVLKDIWNENAKQSVKGTIAEAGE